MSALERLDVELGELLGVVEIVAERVGLRRVLRAAPTRRPGSATSPGWSAARCALGLGEAIAGFSLSLRSPSTSGGRSTYRTQDSFRGG